MQNDNKPKGFRRFLRNNGYYLVIGLCVLAVGVSGFFLLRGHHKTTEEVSASLNVPVTIQPEKTQTPKNPQKDTNTPAAAQEETEPSGAVPPSEETVETASDLSPSESVPSARMIVAPVAGSSIADYSMEALSYNATTRDWRTHDGVDLSAALGSQVVAAENGTVCAVETDDFLGTVVKIQHDSGYTTVYANLAQTPPVEVGQQVSAGQTIGTVGDTALLEIGQEPHLHFSVYQNEQCIAPASYLGSF